MAISPLSMRPWTARRNDRLNDTKHACNLLKPRAIASRTHGIDEISQSEPCERFFVRREIAPVCSHFHFVRPCFRIAQPVKRARHIPKAGTPDLDFVFCSASPDRGHEPSLAVAIVWTAKIFDLPGGAGLAAKPLPAGNK